MLLVCVIAPRLSVPLFIISLTVSPIFVGILQVNGTHPSIYPNPWIIQTVPATWYGQQKMYLLSDSQILTLLQLDYSGIHSHSFKMDLQNCNYFLT